VIAATRTCSPLLARRMHALHAPAMNLLHTLSEREREVLAQIAQGKTNQDIATALHLSENTIKYYLKNVYQKLQVTNRTEAARLYLEEKGQ
jgi:DNA-binding NarL/FixJ family response regulator